MPCSDPGKVTKAQAKTRNLREAPHIQALAVKHRPSHFLLHTPVLCCSNVYHSLSWQAPRTGKNVVLFGEESEHAVKVASQQVLTADLYHARKMVDFLKEVQKKNRIITDSP